MIINYEFDGEEFEHIVDEYKAVNQILNELGKKELIALIKEYTDTNVLAKDFYDAIKINEEDNAEILFLKEKKDGTFKTPNKE